MREVPVPINEERRIIALHSLSILDTPVEERFERITRIASRLFDVPIALITLVDVNRQWFKSCLGLELSETPRNISFCTYAILQDDIMIIPDALTDSRFFANPLVTGEPFIRFYAGCPLLGPDGSKLGTLCIIDRHPREFTDADCQTLRDLASWAETEMCQIQTLQLELKEKQDALHDKNIQLEAELRQRLLIEEELVKAKLAADNANEAKSAFLATMSHELRTPLNGILGMTNLLRDTQLDPEQRDYAETIQFSGDTLLTLINDILDLSKIEAGKLELENAPFFLHECIDSAIDLVAPKAVEKQLELGYLVDDNVPDILIGDITRLRQILVNLLSNALKFTAKGEVIVHVYEDQDEFSLPWRKIHITVRDTGIGIPPEKLSALFMNFSQVDASTTRRYGGTGLGLVISKRLSQLMEGTMWVESKFGEGSTFHFTIKVREATATEALAPGKRNSVTTDHALLRGKRLLIVDDNLTNCKILLHLAESWGMLGEANDSPEKALETIQQEVPYDLAIIDMQMPGMDGLALTREIRRFRPEKELPVILLTSLGRSELKLKDVGVTEFMMKPVKSMALLNTLVQVVSGVTSEKYIKAPPSLFRENLARDNPLRILVAEDNAINQKLILRILERFGYRADIAGNGFEVLEAIETQIYDVILMDVHMPEVDGLTATREIVRTQVAERRPYIIAMTASAMQGDRELCLEAGMNDYLSKPIQIKGLEAALERAYLSKTRQTGQSDTPGRVVQLKESLLDVTFLGELQTLHLPDEPSLLDELLDIFEEDSPAYFLSLEEAVKAGNSDRAVQFAHILAGSSGNLGALGLHSIFQKAEILARTERVSEIATLLPEMKRLYAESCQALQLYRA